MTLFKTVTTFCCTAVLGAILAPGARADDWNRKTVMTFSGPVEIPGVHLRGWGVLPAGTYVFKILDSQSDRHIVQIFDKEETTVYATILAIPNYRLKATDKTVVTFRERAAGQPEALRAWFYPGRNYGEEFVYPKAKAIAIAKAADTAVLFTPAEIPLEVTEPIKSADEPVVAELKRAPIMAIKPTGEEVALAQVVTPPPFESPVAAAREPAAASPAASAAPDTTVSAPETAPATTLPATASQLPSIALLGLAALTAALLIREAGRRIS